ncbi:MAG TPA: hypothetical protein DGD08_14960 [Gemmatimonas aurantiaca]|uniref:Intracellular proteinase inhibitor BsuPI domain-containing protein n=3 Tax=Gemmatimonas aurantiaca TaxID=173480 RepID=C1AB81_GEMAT|nr:hypothetical protein GAU_2445 [Gemmatimonas aurantiaca T-27]HCT58503.1 hypothetical protein [Gemmatimonas aurantiaca]
MRLLARPRLNRTGMVLVLIGMSACTDALRPDRAAGMVRVLVDSEPVATRGMLHVALTNTGNTAVLLGHCPTSVDRRTGSSWIGADADVTCDALLSRLGPGATLHAYIDLPPLPSGSYRLNYRFRDELSPSGDAAGRATSNVFVVGN